MRKKLSALTENPLSVIQYLKIFFTSIAFFTVFRVILLLTELDRMQGPVSMKEIAGSFLLGLRFDTVISCYILSIPFLLVTIFSFFKTQNSMLLKFNTVYITMMFSVAFLICAIDIPYFNQFFSRLSVSAFEWMGSPVFVLKMIAQEPRYWIFLIPLLLIIFIFKKITTSVFSVPTDDHRLKPFIKVLLSALFLFFILIGIRGRIERKSPIRVGTAYFCNNALLNQLGLNANFTLISSYLESVKESNQKIHLIDDAQAIAEVQKYLKIQKPDTAWPLARAIACDTAYANHANVILVIMEGMSVANMARHGNGNKLTPFLDSISNIGYYFENTYTSGVHTYNGIFSTLFSYPALFRQHPMNGEIQKYHGMYSTLKDKGYSTMYVTTHDGQFDNVEGFLKANDCDTVITKADYPSEAVKTILGVPDDYMFEISLPVLNTLSEKGRPFFATYMTASNHGPFYIPEWFKPRNLEMSDQIVEYSDYALKKFVALCAKQTWFNNTIFIFVADHGGRSPGEVYSMSINYNHAPLIFYAPGIFTEHKFISKMAGQIDIFPTVMGLLNLPYVNYTLGIDLFKEERPYIFFNADDKYGVIDQEWLLIVGIDNTKWLHKYRHSDKHNYVRERPDLVEKMNHYAQCNLQAYQYVLAKHKQ